MSATDIQASKGVTISAAGGYSATFTGSSIGPFSGRGLSGLTSFTSTAVNGNVTVKTVYGASLTGNGATVNGNVSLTATNHSDGNVSSAWVDANTVTGQIRQTGTFASTLNIGVGANSLTAKAITLTGQAVSFVATGVSVTVNGNLTVNGSEHLNTTIKTTSLSEVKGNISSSNINGLDALFTTNSFFKADKNISLKFKSVASSALIGDGTAPVAILGNLNITNGAGSDQITLSNVVVSGATQIKTGDGFDILNIDKASVFTGAFTADLGAGDDTINIAQTAGAATPVTFTGKATIRAGIGNDKLTLGKAGGDAGQAVVFAPGSEVDGGTGFNLFDDSLANFSGIALGTGIFNWSP